MPYPPTRLYVANGDSNSVSVSDATTGGFVGLFPVGCAARGIAVNPTTHRIYVANNTDNTISIIDGATNLGLRFSARRNSGSYCVTAP